MCTSKQISYILTMVGILVLIPVLLFARPPATTVPVASAGSIDLRDWDFQNAGPLKLRGEWTLFLNRFVDQDELIGPNPIIPNGYVAVPGSWDEFTDRGQPFGAFGFASYHLKILLSGDNQKLALSFNTISTAARIFVDGQEVGRAGSPGPSRDTMIPDYYPLVIDIPTTGSELNLIVQVSNYYHTQGGLWTDVVIGPESQIRFDRNLNIAISLFIIGSLVVLGLYHMGLYSLREYTKSPFYFGLFSLTIGLRALVTGDIPLHFFFPQFPWWALIRIEYLTFYLGLPLFVNFQRSVFSDEFPRRIVLSISGIGVLFAGLVLVSPSWIFTASLPAFFVVAFISALLCLFFTIKAVYNQRVGARIFLAASILLFVILVNDILYSAEILFTGYYISYGILLFMVSQAFLLSYRFSDSFRTIDRHKKELRLHKDHLEDIVANRMSELTEANNKLKTLTMVDGLTEISNRRRMDNYLLSEWQRMRRDKQPLAFIICDIDFFKLFNDNYGHQAGDECLKRVAGAINAAINRPGDLVARYGGEEFGAILPNTELAGAIQVAERMRQNIEQLNLIHEYSKVSGHITISAGVAVTIPTIESSPQELVELADQRLYKAKNSGRNRVVAD